jgi:hypothetical protein
MYLSDIVFPLGPDLVADLMPNFCRQCRYQPQHFIHVRWRPEYGAKWEADGDAGRPEDSRVVTVAKTRATSKMSGMKQGERPYHSRVRTCMGDKNNHLFRSHLSLLTMKQEGIVRR